MDKAEDKKKKSPLFVSSTKAWKPTLYSFHILTDTFSSHMKPS